MSVGFDKLRGDDTRVHHAKDNHNAFRLEMPRRSRAPEGGARVFVRAMTSFHELQGTSSPPTASWWLHTEVPFRQVGLRFNLPFLTGGVSQAHSRLVLSAPEIQLESRTKGDGFRESNCERIMVMPRDENAPHREDHGFDHCAVNCCLKSRFHILAPRDGYRL